MISAVSANSCNSSSVALRGVLADIVVEPWRVDRWNEQQDRGRAAHYELRARVWRGDEVVLEEFAERSFWKSKKPRRTRTARAAPEPTWATSLTISSPVGNHFLTVRAHCWRAPRSSREIQHAVGELGDPFIRHDDDRTRGSIQRG
jgi:hypothetical protein